MTAFAIAKKHLLLKNIARQLHVICRENHNTYGKTSQIISIDLYRTGFGRRVIFALAKIVLVLSLPKYRGARHDAPLDTIAVAITRGSKKAFQILFLLIQTI